MLFIFRKLRRSFFLPGKVRTYCAYAAGEIILIVVGILLALQISEWNQERRDRAEEQIILRGLKEEFGNHLRWLIDQTRRDEARSQQLAFFMSFIVNDDKVHSLEELDSAAWAAFVAGTWDPVSAVLDGLISSGKLELIQDSILRNKLSGWKNYVDEVRDDQLIMVEYSHETLLPMFASAGAPNASAWVPLRPEMRKWIPEPQALTMYENIKGNSELIQLLGPIYARRKRVLVEMNEAKEEAEEILAIIDSQIK